MAKIATWISIAAMLAHTLFLNTPAYAAAETLFSTEAFSVIDNSDSTATTLDLRFGTALGQRLYYDRTNLRFQFTRSLAVAGDVTATGSITAAGTLSGKSLIISGAASISGATLFRTTVTTKGAFSGASLYGAGLGDCANTTTSKIVYNPATGKFICATDQTGGGGGLSFTTASGVFVNQGGDTMTGQLTIRPTAGNAGIGLNVAATMSGNMLRVSNNATVHGSLTSSGAIRTDSGVTLNDSALAQDAILNFGNSVAGQTIKFAHASQTFRFSRGISVPGTISGTTLVIDKNGSFSGALRVLGNGLFDGGTLFIDSANNQVSVNRSSGPKATFETVGVISGASLIVSGASSFSGAALFRTTVQTKGTFSGQTLRVSGNADVTGILSASGAVHFDANLSLNDDATATDASLFFGNPSGNQYLSFFNSNQTFQLSKGITIAGQVTAGAISGSSLVVSGSSSFSGAMLALRSITTKTSFSGASFFGSGLGSCMGATTDKVLYNPTTGKFSCGADQGGGGGGISQTAADARYVNQSGDSMTGALHIDYASGDVLNLSGGVLHVSPYGSPLQMTGANVGANVRSIYVSGKYAFVGLDSVAGHDLRIFDVHNRSNPTFMSGIDVGANVNVIIRVGKFLYVGTSAVAGTCTRNTVTGCEFRIYDVSNLSSPVAFGGVDFGVGVNDMQVIGELAYIANDVVSGTCSALTGATLNGCEFRVYDISNPYMPAPIGGINDTVDARGLYINGAQALIVYDSDNGAGNELKIFAINNHSNIQGIAGINSGVNGLNFNSITVSGKYAYIGTTADGGACSGATVTGCEFRIYDVGNPSTPTAVGGLDFGVTVNSVEIAANTIFAGLGSNAGAELRSIEVANPAVPLGVGGRELGTGLNSVVLAGKFLYLGADSQAAGNEFFILDAPGIEAPSATIGSIQGSNLTITENARINNTLYIGNGLNVGRGGVNLRGPLSVQSTSTGSLYTGLDIKNLTGTMMFSVRDDGFADAFRGFNGYNGYLGEEFNDEKAAVTADNVVWGDNQSWVGDVSATTCSFAVPDDMWPTVHRSQIAGATTGSAGTGCNLYMGLAAGDPMNFITSTGSWARVVSKARINTTTTSTHVWIGMFGTVAANNVNEPAQGMYFTGSGTTEWRATINPATGVSTYLRCPGANIQTGYGKYALFDITTESPNRVRFRVDPDTTDGIDFINCGIGDPSNVKERLGVGAVYVSRTGATGTRQLDIDYIRAWTK